jgi:hypothetical protein
LQAGQPANWNISVAPNAAGDIGGGLEGMPRQSRIFWIASPAGDWRKRFAFFHRLIAQRFLKIQSIAFSSTSSFPDFTPSIEGFTSISGTMPIR